MALPSVSLCGREYVNQIAYNYYIIFTYYIYIFFLYILYIYDTCKHLYNIYDKLTYKVITTRTHTYYIIHDSSYKKVITIQNPWSTAT